VLLLSGLAGRRKDDERDEQSGSKRFLPLKILALVAGVGTLVVWLLLDNLSQPMVWINAWTIFVAIMFVVHVVILAAYLVIRRRADADDDSEFGQSYQQA
jgi:amino acid transporter